MCRPEAETPSRAEKNPSDGTEVPGAAEEECRSWESVSAADFRRDLVVVVSTGPRPLTPKVSNFDVGNDEISSASSVFVT